MGDLASNVTGADLDGKDATQASPVLALPGSAPVAVAPTSSAGIMDKAQAFFGSASTSVSTTAQSLSAKAKTAASENQGLMWIILAAMVAAGLFLFAGNSKKGGKGLFSKVTSKGRKPSGGSFAR
jgi:hypothetical protein